MPECFETGFSNHQGTLEITLHSLPKYYKKSELMLMKRARAYSSFCSQVILVYLHPFCCNSLFCSWKSQKNH